jgi:hypothetical protein
VSSCLKINLADQIVTINACLILKAIVFTLDLVASSDFTVQDDYIDFASSSDASGIRTGYPIA